MQTYITKKKILVYIIGVLLVFLSCSKKPVKAEKIFKGRTDGAVMKGYFRYGQYEISERFKISDSYEFNIYNEDKILIY